MSRPTRAAVPRSTRWIPTKKRATASTDTAPSRRCQSAPSTMPRGRPGLAQRRTSGDRKSTRLNSSHGYISYAVFCLKKKKHTTRALQTELEPHSALLPTATVTVLQVATSHSTTLITTSDANDVVDPLDSGTDIAVAE